MQVQNPSKESVYVVLRSDDNDELENFFGEWQSIQEQLKWPRGLQFFENASYLQGNHLTRFYFTADSGFGFHHFGLHDHSSFDSLVAKVADNKLIRPFETVVSMLTQNKPKGRVVPNSDLPEDEDAAELAEIVLDLLWEKPLNMQAKLREVAAMGCIAGTTAVEIEYGPGPVVIEKPKVKTRKVPSLFEGEEETEETYLDAEDTEFDYKPDIQARVWNFYNFIPDPTATCPDEMNWIMRQSFVDLDWIKENFSGKAEEGYIYSNLENELVNMEKDVASKSILYWWSKFQDIIETPQYYQHGGGLSPHSYYTHGGYAPNQTILTVIDVKPSKEYPEGRTLIFAGHTLIYKGPARAWSPEYPWRWHPYAFWGWFKIPGKFWHVPMLSQLTPLQKKINSIDALVHANRQYLSIGQWLVPQHSKVPEGALSGIPAQNIPYIDVPGMSPPQKVANVPLPQELLVERDQLERSIEYIAASGFTDPNIAGSAARSGTMLDFIRQEKLRSKSAMLQEFEHMVETVAQNILIEIQLNLKNEDPELTDRMIAAAREHSQAEVQVFTGSSLRDHTSVKIDLASELLSSPEADAAKALEYLQYKGGQLNPVEQEAVFRMSGMDKYARTNENESIKYARRLLSMVATGRIPEVAPENMDTLLMPGVATHTPMVDVFKKYILSAKFQELDQQTMSTVLTLFQACQQLAQAEQEAALRQQMALAQGTNQ